MTGQSKASILEPLRMALRLEEEGRKFFADAAAQVRNPHARQTLAFLADEESKHIERIKDFSRSIEAGMAAPPISASESIEQRVKSFNDHLATLRADMGPTASDVEAYTMAVKFENGAADFLAQCRGHALSFFLGVFHGEFASAQAELFFFTRFKSRQVELFNSRFQSGLG